MILDSESGLEYSVYIQVPLVIVADSTAPFVLRSTESDCLQQDTRAVVGCNDDILVIGRSELPSTQVHVRAAWLRSDDRHGLRWRPAVYVADEAGKADLAFRAGSDIRPNGLVTTNIVHPLYIAVAVVFHNEGIVGIVRGSLNRTA